MTERVSPSVCLPNLREFETVPDYFLDHTQVPSDIPVRGVK